MRQKFSPLYKQHGRPLGSAVFFLVCTADFDRIMHRPGHAFEGEIRLLPLNGRLMGEKIPFFPLTSADYCDSIYYSNSPEAKNDAKIV